MIRREVGREIKGEENTTGMVRMGKEEIRVGEAELGRR